MIGGWLNRTMQEVTAMQLKNILLPYDGSKHSANAAAYAVHLAKANGAKVTIVHCYDLNEHTVIPEGFIIPLETGMKKRAEKYVSDCSAMLEEAGIPHEKRIIAGDAGKEITDLAKSKDYDLVVMGSVGHSDIAGLLMGSVSHKVISTMHCPVMIVP